MIDFIKLKVNHVDIDKLLRNPRLDFKANFSLSTSEIEDSIQIADIHFIKIIVKTTKVGKIVQLQGSLHKMFNSIKKVKAPQNKSFNGFNGNLFDIDEINFTIRFIEELLDTKSYYMKVENIELGFNCKVEFNPKLFIKGLLYHKGKSFEFQRDHHYAQVVHQRFLIKIYNKGKQYGLPQETLRLEIKFIKSIEIQKMQIKKLSDISCLLYTSPSPRD